MKIQLLNFKGLSLLGAAFLALTACSKAPDQPSNRATDSAAEWSIFGNRIADTVLVTDEKGRPVVGAQVLIGTAVNQPFGGNLLTTDAEGRFVRPEKWQQAEMVTVFAAGYVRATYTHADPSSSTLKIRKQNTNPQVELAGQGTGFNVVNYDGQADFAVMMSALKKNDFFTFDLSMVISPEMDRMRVMGQDINIPSNVSVPKQKETYIIGLTLEKPRYRLYFHEQGPKMVYTVRGQFPFRRVVDEMRSGGKQFYDLINLFSLNGGSIRELDLTAQKTELNIPVNELNYTGSATVNVPRFAADQYMMMLSASEYKGHYLPTDVKNVESGKTQALKVSAGTQNHLISVLKPKNENTLGAGRLSAVIQPMANSLDSELLSIMAPPRVQGVRHVRFDKPQANGIHELATYSMLSKVDVRTVGEMQMEVITRLWDVYSPGWTEGFDLPELPGDAPVQGNKRWEVSVVGSHVSSMVDLGPKIFETATHASLTFFDFQ